MIWFEVWKFGALIMLISTIPVTFECLCEVFNRNESRHNRQGAALWIPVMWVACALWPLLIVASIGMLVESFKDKRKAKAEA